MTEHKSRRKVTEVQALITDEQKAFINADGRSRYPHLAAASLHGRHFSPTIRDIIDFARAHYAQFKTWIETERNTP
jgi:hypothetical protein